MERPHTMRVCGDKVSRPQLGTYGIIHGCLKSNNCVESFFFIK